MGISNNSLKSSYYRTLKKELKRSYEQGINIKLNKEIIKQWIKRNTKIISIEVINTDWKIFLLNQLNNKEYNTEKWKDSLNIFIQKKINNNQTYFFESEILLEQFYLSFFPKLSEINKYKLNPKKVRKISENMNEKILIDNNNNIIEDNKSERLIKSNENLISNNESRESSSVRSDSDTKIKNANLKKIYISIIEKHLKMDDYPINAIINKFSEEYTNIINNKIQIIKNERNENNLIEEIKNKVIKDIQTFVEIIKVAIKLYYLKVINYEYFLDEKDEVFDLVSSILFNKTKFYKSLFELFELSNEKKNNDLKQQKIKFGILNPEDVGIDTKFCLNDETKKLKNNKDYLKNENKGNKNKSKIVDYFEKMHSDNSEKSYESHNEKEVIRLSYDFGKKKDDISDSYYNIKKQSSYRTFDYKEFSNNLENSIKELDNLQIDNSSLFSFNSNFINSKIPYKSVINCICSIKNYQIPYHKLKIIAYSSSLISKCIEEFWKDADNNDNNDNNNNLKEKYLKLNSDEIIKIYLYLIYNINLDSIFTEIDLIKCFAGNKLELPMFGYYYDSIKGILDFIMDAETKDDLK